MNHNYRFQLELHDENNQHDSDLLDKCKDNEDHRNRIVQNYCDKDDDT